MKRYWSILIVLLFAASILATAGCNTIHGMGKDIEQLGRAISGD